MSNFFDEITIGNTTLSNRIIMAPMTRSRANDEGVQPAFAVEYYRQRASAGLIITEAVNISPMAKGYIRTPGIYTEDQIESWRKIADAVHSKGGKIFMQLFHAGRIALPDFLPEGVEKPFAPSAVKADGTNYTDEGMKEFVEPKTMSIEEIKNAVKEFAVAARNAINAGFDGVELHAANGYLVQQFLTTNANKRQDEYGGTIENRARFLLEVMDAIINEVGAEQTSIRLSPRVQFNDVEEDNAEELYKYIITELNKRRIAFLDIGSYDPEKDWHPILRPIYKGVYFAGGFFDKKSGEQFLQDGKADAMIYGKLFIANPDLTKRFRLNAGLNDWDESTFYSPGEKGYTDYPTLEEAKAV